MRSMQVLIIDDEPAIRQILASTVSKAGHTVSTAADGESALRRLAKGDIDVALCDLRMPGVTGIEVVSQSRKAGIDTTFLIMTAFASVDTAIEAMRAGAYDYMLKPLRNEDVLNRLQQLADVIGLRSENRLLREMVRRQDDVFCPMVSPPMKEIERLVAKVAPTDSTVLITGASGTGKGVIARSIHQLSKRSEAPLVAVNCGAIPENLLESEFFGHTKGAFTGAHKAKHGLFVEADQGTLFLDEIGELPTNLQVKLLHAIEDQVVRAVGSEQIRKISVRIISATNQDLRKMVADGKFREDLYFRLNVFNIALPPLAERPEDVNQMIDFLIVSEARKLGLVDEIDISPEARNMLCQYDWPGNVRELQNAVARALILAEDNLISCKDLPRHVQDQESAPADQDQRIAQSLKDQLREYEVAVIQRTIEDFGGNRKKAASKLGIGVSSLYRKIEDAGDRA